MPNFLKMGNEQRKAQQWQNKKYLKSRKIFIYFDSAITFPWEIYAKFVCELFSPFWSS